MSIHDEKLRSIMMDAFEFGSFLTKQKKKSHFYINGQHITSNPYAMYLISKEMLQVLKKWDVQGVCGEVSGSLPLLGSIITLSYLENYPLQAYFIRKESKRSHGLSHILDTKVKKDTRVVVIDDVFSSGATALRCKSIMENEGAVVVGALAIIDRMMGASKALNFKSFYYRSLFTIDDFKDHIEGGKEYVSNSE